MKFKTIFKNNSREFSVIIGLIALAIVFSLINPLFISGANIRDIVEQGVIYGLMGIGMTFAIITGGIDLSVGSILALVAVTLSKMLVSGMNMYIAMIIALALGVCMGILNGFIVAKMKLQPFVATMGTMSLYRGIGYVITQGIPVSKIPSDFRDVMYGVIIPGSGIRSSILVFILFAVICGIVLRKTRFGSYLYALGGNEEAAKLSGVKIAFNKICAYVMCAIGSTLAGIVLVAKLGAGEPTAANGYELDAIAAAAIGGTSMSGGRGTILGTFFGAMLFSSLKIGLICSGVDSFWQYIATGVVIIIAAYVEIVQSQISSASKIKK